MNNAAMNVNIRIQLCGFLSRDFVTPLLWKHPGSGHMSCKEVNLKEIDLIKKNKTKGRILTFIDYTL